MPDVNVDDSKGGGDGPGVDKLTLVSGEGVGEDAVRAGFDPCFHICAQFVPVEAESDSVEGFVLHEVPSGGRGVEGAKESVAEAGGWDDEEECAAVAIEGLGVGEAVVLQADKAVTERGLVGGGKLAEEGFRKGVVGVLREGSEDWFEDVVGKVSSSPFIGFGEGREEGAGYDVLSGGSQGLEVVA